MRKTATETPALMRMKYMYKNEPCTIIDIDFLNQKIEIENRTDNIVRRAFGVCEHPTWDDFEYFLKDRCFPETRDGTKQILKDLGLTDYDPLQIVEKTKGRTAEDQMWIRFTYPEKRKGHNGKDRLK